MLAFVASCYLAGQFAKKRRRERMEEEMYRKQHTSSHPLRAIDGGRGGRVQNRMTPISTPRAAVGLGHQERFVPSWYNPSIAAATPNIYGMNSTSKL